MSCLKKIQIDDTIYTANVDFRNVIKCNAIATDDKIGDMERSLGLICTLFGNDGLDKCEEHPTHYEKLQKWALNYFSCGKEVQPSNEQPDMDYEEDMEYIEASFMSDYGIDLENTEMDWQKFNKLMNGLSNSELGNCCVLNRVRNLRNFDVSSIKDNKERQKIAEAKEQVALKKYKRENHLTKEQEESMERLNEILGL